MSTSEANLVIETPVVTPETTIASTETDANGKPRDPSTGRFTSAKIREAAGLPPEAVSPSEPTPVAAVSPAAATEAPAAPTASSLDAELAAIAAVAAPETPTPVAVVPTPTPQPTFAPQTPEAAQLLAIAQNPAQAQQVIANNYQWQRLDQALNQGDVNTLMTMLHPAVQQRLVDHIYSQHKDSLAQRYADEANGVQRDPRLDQLSQTVQQLQQTLTQRDQQARQAYEQQQQHAVMTQHAQGLVNTINSYFTAVKVAPDAPHRPFLEAALYRELQNPATLATFREGKFGLVRPAFEKVWKDWKAANPGPAVSPTAAPAPSATLMSQPQGTASVQQGPSADEQAVKNRHLDSSWWAAQKDRLKSMIG